MNNTWHITINRKWAVFYFFIFVFFLLFELRRRWITLAISRRRRIRGHLSKNIPSWILRVWHLLFRDFVYFEEKFHQIFFKYLDEKCGENQIIFVMQVTGHILFMLVFMFLEVDVILTAESQGATQKMMANLVASIDRVSVASNMYFDGMEDNLLKLFNIDNIASIVYFQSIFWRVYYYFKIKLKSEFSRMEWE